MSRNIHKSDAEVNANHRRNTFLVGIETINNEMHRNIHNLDAEFNCQIVDKEYFRIGTIADKF